MTSYSSLLMSPVHENSSDGRSRPRNRCGCPLLPMIFAPLTVYGASGGPASDVLLLVPDAVPLVPVAVPLAPEAPEVPVDAPVLPVAPVEPVDPVCVPLVPVCPVW